MSSRNARRRRRRQRANNDPRLVLASDDASEETTPETTPVSGPLVFKVIGSTKGRLPKFRVQVFEVGFGKNFEGDAQWYVPPGDEGVGSAVKVFGGARVHWHAADASTFGHVEKALAKWLNSNHNVGYLSDVKAAANGLEATLVIDEPNTPPEIIDALRSGTLGFSVEAFAHKRIAVRAGRKVVELVNWHHPDDGPASVAIVSHPALGGAVLSVAAAVRAKETRMEIKDRAHALQVLASADSSDEQVNAARKWLRNNPEKESTPTPAPAPATPDPSIAAAQATKVEAEKLREELAAERDRLAKDRARIEASKQLDEANLPTARSTRILASLSRLMDVDQEMRGEKVAEWIGEEIKAEQKVIDETVRVNGAGAVAIGAEPRDKMQLRLERLFGENDPDWAKKAIAEKFHNDRSETLEKRYVEAGMSRREREFSFRQILRQCTGYDITDLRYRGPEMSKRVQAAFTTSGLADALENVMHKRFLGHFENPMFVWRKLVRINPLGDFRKVERISRGNYANLAIVSEAGAYAAMTSWGDEGHGYTPQKRGGTDTVTWETMVNDDVGIMRDIAPSMAYAAGRTLDDFVASRYIPTTTATMDYDSSPVYQATVHGNRVTSALTSTALIADFKAMYKMTDISSSKRLAGGNVMKKILVPIDLEDTAFNLTKARDTFPGGSTADYEYIRQRQIEPVTIPGWTDTNNWVAATEGACEIGFLGGREEPELFLEGGGAQNIGDYLTNDRQKWKVRHVYGGAILRHEFVRGHVV